MWMLEQRLGLLDKPSEGWNLRKLAAGPFYAHPEENWREELPEGLCSREGDLPCVGCA